MIPISTYVRLNVRVAMLFAVLANASSSARQLSTCQPDCAEEKRECRTFAQNDAKRENGPLAIMNEPLPHIVGSGDARGRSIAVRARERQDFENRKMERTRACDDKYMKCVNVCPGRATGKDEGSVVLKRKDEL